MNETRHGADSAKCRRHNELVDGAKLLVKT